MLRLAILLLLFFFNDTATTEIYTLSLHDALPIYSASMGLLSGQDIFTVDSMQAKIEAQVRGIGCGFLPHFMADVYVQAGLLVTRQVARPSRNVRMHYAWSCPPQQDPPRALPWWLQQLES